MYINFALPHLSLYFSITIFSPLFCCVTFQILIFTCISAWPITIFLFISLSLFFAFIISSYLLLSNTPRHMYVNLISPPLSPQLVFTFIFSPVLHKYHLCLGSSFSLFLYEVFFYVYFFTPFIFLIVTSHLHTIHTLSSSHPFHYFSITFFTFGSFFDGGGGNPSSSPVSTCHTNIYFPLPTSLSSSSTCPS